MVAAATLPETLTLMVTLLPWVTVGSENVTVQEAAQEMGVVRPKIMTRATNRALRLREKSRFIELLPIY